MKVQLYFKQNKHTVDGSLTVAVRDLEGKVIEEQSIRNVVARSGAPGWAGTQGVRGKSPIPDGKYILWNRKRWIMQYNDLDATGREIGRFYPISDNPTNRHIISHPTGVRKYIGLHDENDFRGSAGCVVVVNNAQFRRICKLLEKYPGKLDLFVWTV